jgi:predicted N-acyltransferase
MSTRPEFSVEIRQAIDSVPEEEWDRLLTPDDPFTCHAFLSVLERSGSATTETGWFPVHVLCRHGERLVGAAPLYLKNHSYGEYIFDWGWAQAARRAGLAYYPKLVCAVPFTPATGHRFLVAPGEDAPTIRRALLGAMTHVAREAGAHSLHVLFSSEEETEDLSTVPGISPRLTHQYHWVHPGVADFDAWLATMRSRRRKEIRRERRRPSELNVEIQVLRGADLLPSHWEALECFYRSTVDRKYAQAYLTPEFFSMAQTRLAHLAVGILALEGSEVRAGALAFQRGSHLYGRYWGCQPGFEALHFEICYHRPIELCLEQGWTRFEAGAQGEHKIARGLLPSPTRSLHWMSHAGLARAVARSNEEERAHTLRILEDLSRHGPFHRSEES